MTWTLLADAAHHEVAGRTYWMPFELSEVAEKVDAHFYFLTWLTAFFFFGITGLLVYFVVKYRRRTPDQKPLPSPSHHNLMEVTWTVIPTLVVIGLFYVGMMVYQDLMTAPRETMKISVTGQRWFWQFQYMQAGLTDANEIHVPANVPIELTLTSTDVIHSFYVPVLRVKKDVVPGRYSKLWFNARNDTGKVQMYNVFCAEYCGTSHSEMYAKLYVHPTLEDFQTWVKKKEEDIQNLPPVKLGQRVYEIKGCRGCHSIDGKAGTGPTFLGLWGSTNHRVIDNTDRQTKTIDVNENYIRMSIEEPNLHIREGFPNPSPMPSFKGRLSPKEMTGIIEYLKTLGQGAEGAKKTPQ